MEASRVHLKHTHTHTHTREDLHKCKKDVVKPPVGCERDLPDDVVVKKPPLCFSEHSIPGAKTCCGTYPFDGTAPKRPGQSLGGDQSPGQEGPPLGPPFPQQAPGEEESPLHRPQHQTWKVVAPRSGQSEIARSMHKHSRTDGATSSAPPPARPRHLISESLRNPHRLAGMPSSRNSARRASYDSDIIL